MSNDLPVPGSASLLIGSSNVDVMKDWYRNAFGVAEDETGAFPFGATGVFIEPHSEVMGPTAEPARMIVNLNVEDCRALGAHLESMDVTWIRPVEHEPFGWIGTVADPDGNYVQIIEWGGTED